MKIAIAGYGVEGKSNYEYFSKLGDVTIVDEKASKETLPDGVLNLLGEGVFGQLTGYDMVVRTAGLAPNKITTDGKIWSATNEFFAHCPAPIIGVTGTKGKGTTSMLIAEILRASGKTVHLVGNIGTPALSVLPQITPSDIVVYELSSFQLWDLERSPKVAVVLLVEPDHLNVHADFDDYVMAKANIAAHQQPDDTLIYHPNNEQSARIAATSSAAHKLQFMTPDAAYIVNGEVRIGDETICRVDEVGLLGEFNLQNICAAISAAWQFTHDIAAIATTVRRFKGLPHRLEFVAEKEGVRFYNDSFSSAPTATMAAITAFAEPIVLIVGGFDRGIDLTPLAKSIAETKNVARVLVIGQIRERLVATLEAESVKNVEKVEETKMETIVHRAVQVAKPGDIVLLSPGCASFDMFKDFYDRGDQFKQAVEGL